MAGLVRARAQGWGDSLMEIAPDVCPAAEPEQQSRMRCCIADPMRSHANLCPFVQRFVLDVTGSVYDVITMDAVMQWLAVQGITQGNWRTLCLRKESKGTEPGARLRP